MNTTIFVKLLYLAFRNLFRNKRRTLFTLLIATCGFTAMGIAAGYYSYSVFGIQELTIRNGFSGAGGTGHIQIRDARFFQMPENHALEYGLKDYKQVSRKLMAQKDVDYVFPRIEFGGLISNGDKSLPFIGYGVNPDLETKLRLGLRSVNPVLKAGKEMLPLKTQQNVVVLGDRLAHSLNAKIGDTLMLYSTTVDGGVNAIDVTLANVMTTGINDADAYYLLTNIGTVQQVINTSKVSLLAVMYKDRANLTTSVGETSKALDSVGNQKFAMKNWEELGEYYRSVKDLFRIIFTFMGLIIIIIVILSCWNISNMATMERIREIGTLRAIGIKTRFITLVFLFEGFLISLLGVILGFILEIGIAHIINALLIPMPPIPGMNQGYFLQVYSITEYHPWLAIAVVFAITFSSLSSFFTIRHLSIIESIEHT
jgi:putative ABC transport system permease protein